MRRQLLTPDAGEGLGGGSCQPRQDLLGQQHEGFVAEGGGEQVVEADLVAQAADVVGDLVRRAVDDDLVQIALDRVDLRRVEGLLQYRPMLRAKVGIDDPAGAVAGGLGRLLRGVGDRHQPGDRDVAAALGEAGSGQARAV